MTAPTAEARALIAAGRAHDEAMTEAPWYGRSRFRFVSRVPNSSGGMGGELQTNRIANTAEGPDADGIAWLRTNLRALLDGYAAALDEIDHATSRGGR